MSWPVNHVFSVAGYEVMVTRCDIWCQGGGSGLKAATPKPKGQVALALKGE